MGGEASVNPRCADSSSFVQSQPANRLRNISIEKGWNEMNDISQSPEIMDLKDLSSVYRL